MGALTNTRLHTKSEDPLSRKEKRGENGEKQQQQQQHQQQQQQQQQQEQQCGNNSMRVFSEHPPLLSMAYIRPTAF